MHTFHKFLFGLSVFLCASSAHAATLLEIYQAGRDSDPEYLAAIADVKAQMEYVPQNTAPLMPQLRLDLGWQRNVPNILKPGQFNDSANSTWGAKLTLQQTLFDGVKIINYKASALRLTHAEIDATRAEHALIQRAADAYIAYLQARNNLRFAEAEITALDRQLNDLQARYEVGLIAITDLELVRARKDLASANQLSASQSVSNAQEIIAEIFGQAVEAVPDFKATMAMAMPQPASVIEWENTAQSHNLDKRYLQTSLKLAEGNVKRQFAKHLPVVSAVAEYEYRDQTETAVGGEILDRRLGVNVAVPLFGGGQIFSLRREAEQQQLRIQHQLEAARRQVGRSVRASYREIETSIRRAAAFKQAEKSARTSLAAVKEGYEVGNSTITDVLNSERDVLSAQRDAANARYQYVLSHLQLALVAGQLSADDLIQLNSQLEGQGLSPESFE